MSTDTGSTDITIARTIFGFEISKCSRPRGKRPCCSKFSSHQKEMQRRLNGYAWDKKQQEMIEAFYKKRNAELDAGHRVKGIEGQTFVPGNWEFKAKLKGGGDEQAKGE